MRNGNSYLGLPSILKISFKTIVYIFILFGINESYSQGSQTFGSGGGNGQNVAGAYTFTVPIGVTSIKVTVRGGGGGGGANFTTTDGTGGGGGGGVAIINSYPVVAGSVFNLFVGSNGTGGVGGTNGGNGGQSWFINNSSIFANGGIGGLGKQAGGVAGIGGLGGSAGGSLANLFFNGGRGGDGNTNPTIGSGGGGGSSAGTGSNGNNGGNGADDLINGGAGGLAPIGGFAGGLGGLGGNGSGSNGKAPGGGGGGTSNIPPNGNIPIGGLGGIGQVVIEWTCPSATISLPPVICKNVTSIFPIFSGSLGGVWSATTAGLTINSSTGEINATTSTAENYRVLYTIPSDRGCSRVDPRADFSINPMITATLTSQVNVFCKGASTGSVVITPGGGVVLGGGNPPVYSIAPAQINLSAGIKIFTVTDAVGCTATVSANITEPANGIALSETHINIPCFESGDIGSAIINASGGTAPYTGTGLFTNLPVGTHTFIVTDAALCSSSINVTITKPTNPITITSSNQVNVLCKGNSTGSISINPSGGTPFLIGSPYLITPSQTNLTAGLKTFTATDANGCTANIQITITEPDFPLTANITNQVNVLCKGNSTGSVLITPSGGTPGYTISPAQTNLTAGLKTFTVTDANGCTTTINVNITEPNLLLTVSATNQINVACKGNATGSVTILPVGGTPNYSISPAQTGLTAGLKTFTISDANGCTATITSTITEPDLPLSAQFTSVTNVLCKGTATGSVEISPSGGTAPYNISSATSGLTIGLKTFTITDANGCTTSLSIQINEPSQFLSASTSNQVNILCKGAATGSVVITPTGGIAPYSITPAQTDLTAGLKTFTVNDFNGCAFSLNVTITEPAAILTASISNQVNVLCKGNATGTVTIIPLGGVGPYSISPSQTNLTAGIKTYTVTDANGCTSTLNASITEPNQVLSASIANQTNVDCFGAATGSVNINTVGGTAPYQIIPSTNTLSAGNYTFIITDVNGCSTSINVVITQPNPISVSATNIFIPINSTGSLTANCGLTSTKWYDATGNNLLFTGNNFTTPVLLQTTTYKVRCENGICINSFANIIVNVGIFSLKTGNWEDVTTWSVNRIPLPTDNVVIDTGHTVSINNANANAKNINLNLNGILRLANTTSKLNLNP